MKITPAHDANDFEVGRRHGLADASTSSTADAHDQATRGAASGSSGLDRFEAREAGRRASSSALGAAREGRSRTATPCGHCYRCDTVVEPRLSDQWFVKMAPLAEPALEAYRDGRDPHSARSAGKPCTRTGWRTSATGTSRGSSGGGIGFPVWYCDAACGARAARTATTSTACPECGGPVRAGRGRARHLVLVVALAVLHARLARARPPTSRAFYPDRRARHRARRSSSSGSRA